MSKCAKCIRGGFEADYNIKFATAIKKINNKIKRINYKKGESGCRMTQWQSIETKCINNNFSECLKK